MMRLSVKDSLKYQTKVALTLYDEGQIVYKDGRAFVEGHIKQKEQSVNQIVDNGHIYIANKLAGKSVNWMRYMAVGDSSGGKNASSNALENELSRIYMTDWENSGTKSLTYRAIYDSGVGTGNLVEAGIFDNQLAGNMLSWSDFALIAKTINDILEIEWTHIY